MMEDVPGDELLEGRLSIQRLLDGMLKLRV
jgi:hypothetical protein